ncbi:MAG: tRNA lysidine(34) synthetase TilS [Eubacteriales bacterium]|nr:tRNA lysidine(34) synthetase TilS [Eubacteriales bacterium]
MQLKEFHGFQELLNALNGAIHHNTYIYHNVGIAVSGGADSIALLYTAYLLRKSMPIRIYAIHVEHGIRGQSSINDANFVQQLCKELDISLYIKHIEGLQDIATGLEEKARKARYQVFQEAYKELSLDCILLAHHLNDQCETLLMNIARGTGIEGLCGIRQRSVMHNMHFIRPFINISKLTILQVLQQNDISFCEDESNMDNTFIRNKIRNEILPILENGFPALQQSLLRLSAQATEDTAYFNVQVDRFIMNHAYIEFPFCCAKLDAMLALPTAIASRVIKKMYQIALLHYQLEDNVNRLKNTIDYTAIQNVLHLLKQENFDTIELANGIFVSKEYKCLHFTKDKTHIATNLQECIDQKICAYLNAFIFKIVNMPKGVSNGKLKQAVSKTILDKAVWRFREPGDMFMPFGMHGKMPLKKYFIDKKIDKSFRNVLPLLAIGKDVLWVSGVGASELLRTNDTNGILEIQQILPWM